MPLPPPQPLPPSGGPSPLVTVVVTTRNEERNVPAFLDPLDRQTLPRSLFRVILVDNHLSALADCPHDQTIKRTGKRLFRTPTTLQAA